MKHTYNHLQLDALAEITNIGIGHAAIALSQMLGKKIMIAVTRSEIVPSDAFLKNIVGGKDAEVAGIYLKTLGDVQGTIMYMFQKSSALKLGDLLLARESSTTKFVDEHVQSALKELGGILTGAFFTVIADMLKLKVFHQAPYFAYDTAETIMYGVCEDIFGDRNERLCLATEFIESGSQITGTFAFVPTQKAMAAIISKLKLGR